MFKIFYPYEYMDSVFAIDYDKLYAKGYRGILFDIDNTLVYHGEDSTPEVDALFKTIHKAGLKTIILSNNSEERVLRFLKNIKSPYIYDAGKPNPKSYIRAVKGLHIKREEAVVIGDQIFTDIYGANRCGLASILVKFIRKPEETYFGKRRDVENVLLKMYEKSRYNHRIGDVWRDDCKPPVKRKKLFCEINPTCYAISEQKEILKRHIKDIRSKKPFAREISDKQLPNVVYEHSSYMIKKGPGIDPVLQENKAGNIRLAASTMNGIIIHPGETFSFWNRVGKLTRKKGYKDGRVIEGNVLKPGLGGGLCNLANTLHLLVLHSPLKVTEFHSHSDALAPDHGKRVPFSAGTSVSYNQIDYRFCNTTDQDVQLCVWCENDTLYAQLRSEREFPWTYEISEEGHHFSKEDGKYYRISKIYKNTIDKVTGENIEKKLVLDNHSEVMFDYSLIPEDQIQ